MKISEVSFGQCKLCLKETVLAKSHIIPECFYEPIYGKTHSFLLYDLETRRKTYRYKGIKEFLLCDTCEKFLNQQYEDMFCKFWHKLQLDYPSPQKNDNSLTIKNIYYLQTKLFLLSVLWRASVAKNNLWSNIELGAYEDVIRNMILNENPGSPLDYPIFGAIVINPETNGYLNNLITKPIQEINNGVPMALFVFGGIAWIFVIAQNIKLRDYHLIALTGDLRLEIKTINEIKPLLVSMVELGNKFDDNV